MHPAALDELAAEWIAGQATGGVGTREWRDREELMLEVLILPEEKPELAWEFILTVIGQQPPDNVLRILSAGLLEDLLTSHGPQFIERVAEQAAESPVFKHTLGGVWLDSEDTPLWREVYAIAGVEPPFPEGWRDDPAAWDDPGRGNR